MRHKFEHKNIQRKSKFEHHSNWHVTKFLFDTSFVDELVNLANSMNVNVGLYIDENRIKQIMEQIEKLDNSWTFFTSRPVSVPDHEYFRLIL